MANAKNRLSDSDVNAPQSMTMVLMPESEWNKIQQQLDDIKSFVVENKSKKEEDVWLSVAETQAILKVSKKTLQVYRNRHYIPFSQFGKKICFKKSDIERFRNGNIIEADGGDINFNEEG